MVKMVRVWLLLVLCAALQAVAEPRQEQASGLLWEISAPQLKAPSYLFGTIHSEDERVLALPAEVSNALQRSTLFAMEMEPSDTLQEQANRRMMLGNGQSLAGLLDKALYKQAVATMAQLGVPEQVTAQLKPWALTMIVSIPKPRTGLFLDVKLYQSAMAQQKKVVGLETADEQLDTLDGLPMAMQVELLRHTLAHYEEIGPLNEKLIAIWLQRDLAALQRLADESNEGLARNIEQTVQARMVDERNKRMVERMEPLLQKQGSFVAVGALHLPGEKGIISLLRQRGYTVRALY